jgi:predicted nucleic acid-binding protein
VLDTDALVAALRSSSGASRQVFLAALEGRFRLLVSVPLVLEYEAVLKRPEHLTASGLTGLEVERILDDLVGISTPVGAGFRWRIPMNDPNDAMVLEAAINGGADAIITFNVRHFMKASEPYRLKIITPAYALREIGVNKP